MPRERKFEYDAVRRETAFRERYQIGFIGLLFAAARGDSEPLSRRLLSDQPLSAEEREGLAWLVQNKLQAPSLGRRPGRAKSPFHDAAWRIYDDVCARREAERNEAGRKALPKGRLMELVREAIIAEKERGGTIQLPDEDYILSLLKR